VNEKARRWLPVPVLAVGALAAWLVAHGRSGPEAQARVDPGPLVRVLEMQPRDVQVTVLSQGTVDPRAEIDLVAEIRGRAVSVAPALAAGGFFEEGDLLVELDSHDARVAVDRARAVLARSQSEASLASHRLERLRRLAESEIASPADLEEAHHEERIARARMAEARAAHAQSTRNLERTRLLAPFTGRVRSKHIDTGQYVTAGTPVARVYSADSFEVRLPIPNSELAYLDLSELGSIETPEGTSPVVHLHADFAGRRVDWSGRIVRMEAAIAPESRMLHVVARVDDPLKATAGRATPDAPVPLTVGLFVHAEILGRSFEGVFVVPRSALRGRSQVLVVDEDERLRAREVRVLRVEGEHVLASSGLVPGDRVALNAAQALEGMRIRTALIAPDTAR
jgi:RND family efflux transporter MFP subunit